MTLVAPYPADTRAKGWRFEIDYEKVEQSDTWSLAAEVPMAQPALLMLWLMAWTQAPCGSLPNDENLIRVKCRIPAKAWPALRPILMRGWWVAEDGRLYHDTIVNRVLEMLEYRRKDAERKGKQRGSQRDSERSHAGQPRDSTASHDTGTGTGTGTGTNTLLAKGVPHASPGEACKAMKAAGLQAVSPSHPKLIALLDAGITLDELTDAARDATAGGKPFAYALATAEGRRRDAATAPLPAKLNKQEAQEARNAALAEDFLKETT